MMKASDESCRGAYLIIVYMHVHVHVLLILIQGDINPGYFSEREYRIAKCVPAEISRPPYRQN